MTSPTKVEQSVVIVQSYVPSYRQALFEQLRDRLGDNGVTLTLLTARPSRQQKQRRDEVQLDFQHAVRGASVKIAGRHLRWKSLRRKANAADLVICELASGVLENYPLALRRTGRLATWGHGYAATTKPNRLDTMLERWLMRRSTVFFAYTERGRQVAIDNGLAASRVVVLHNTVDTTGLREAVDQVFAHPALGSVDDWDVGADDTICVFLGALDRSKRLDFLLAACELIWHDMPSFKLLIAGDGPERDLVQRMVSQRPYLRYIGRVGDVDKARIAANARLMLNPGRVGLVAVDSFVMGTPIVTTDWAFHAPEFDYLVHGENALIVGDSVDEYAREVLRALRDPQRLDKLVAGCRAAASELTMESLVERFSDGILRALHGPFS